MKARTQRGLLTGVALVTLAGSAFGQSAQLAGPLPAPSPLFPADN